jgi:hypothetical protein
MENLELIPDYGDLMTIDEFIANVASGMFTDYDGFGHWCNSTHILSNDSVYPSEAGFLDCPPGTTHVVWFNR